MLASFLSGVFLLRIPCWLFFSVGSFHYTSRAGFIFMWGVSLTHPMLTLFLCGGFLLDFPVLTSFLSGKFVLYIPCSFLFSFLSGEFLLHIPCWLRFYWGRGGGGYASNAGFVFILGVSLKHPVLVLHLSGEFLLHVPCSFHIYVGSFSYVTHPMLTFTFMWGVSLTHPMLTFTLMWGVSLTHPMLTFTLMWGVSLTRPVLPSFLFGEFLFHIRCWLHFYRGSFSYASHAGFPFLWGVSITHPMLSSFVIWGVSLTLSRFALSFIWKVCLTHPVLFSHLSGEFFLHISC